MLPVTFINPNKKPEPQPSMDSVRAWKIDDGFKEIDEDEFKEMKVGEFLAPSFRFVIRAIIDGFTYRFVSHEEDYQVILDKYPKDITLKVSQVMFLFSKVPEFDPKVLFACSLFNARVVPDPLS